MKAIAVALGLIVTVNSFSQATKKETFKVAGECGMCKKHIEKAAKALPGVSSATWNTSTKLFTVVYQPTKVSVDSIQGRIAAAGYDTPKFQADDAAYKSLDECCQYDRSKSPAAKKNNN